MGVCAYVCVYGCRVWLCVFVCMCVYVYVCGVSARCALVSFSPFSRFKIQIFDLANEGTRYGVKLSERIM